MPTDRPPPDPVYQRVEAVSGFAYGAIFALATLVEPKPREITVTIPPDKLAKPR